MKAELLILVFCSVLLFFPEPVASCYLWPVQSLDGDKSALKVNQAAHANLAIELNDDNAFGGHNAMKSPRKKFKKLIMSKKVNGFRLHIYHHQW